MTDEAKTLSVKERLALQNTSTPEKTVISCTELRPICLNRGKGKMVKQDDGTNKLINPKMIVDCLGYEYKPKMGLDYLLRSFNDKTIFARNSDQTNANCYQVDLAWLIIFKDIILMIDEMIVKMIKIEELIKKKSLGETITPPPVQQQANSDDSVIINNEDDFHELEVLVEEKMHEAVISGEIIDLFDLFTKLIEYGKKKWEMENVMNVYTECATVNCPYLNENKNNKNDCIAFIILNKFRELINDKGFKSFSDNLKSPFTMSETENSTKASDILKAINDVFNLSLSIMNNKTDLTNVYNNKTIEDVYSEIDMKTNKIKGALIAFVPILQGGVDGKTVAAVAGFGVAGVVAGACTLVLASPELAVAAGAAVVGAIGTGIVWAIGGVFVGLFYGIRTVKRLFDSKETKQKRKNNEAIIKENKIIRKEMKIDEDKKNYIIREVKKDYIEKKKFKYVSLNTMFNDLTRIDQTVFIGTIKKEFGIFSLNYYNKAQQLEKNVKEYEINKVGVLINNDGLNGLIKELDPDPILLNYNFGNRNQFIQNVIGKEILNREFDVDKEFTEDYIEKKCIIRSLADLKATFEFSNPVKMKFNNKKIDAYEFTCLFDKFGGREMTEKKFVNFKFTPITPDLNIDYYLPYIPGLYYVDGGGKSKQRKSKQRNNKTRKLKFKKKAVF